jgi:hypothetical protein
MRAERDPKNTGTRPATVVSPQAARSGVISGRILVVLSVSLVLAIIAMAIILPYFHDPAIVAR